MLCSIFLWRLTRNKAHVLDNEHPQLFELLAKALDVVADDPVVYIYIRSVIEYIEGPRHINLQRRGDAVGFPFLLVQQALVQVAQDEDIFGLWVVQVGLVNDAYTAVNHRFFHGFKPVSIAHDQLTQAENEVGLEGQRAFIVRIVQVQVHRVDVVGAGGRDSYDLPMQTFHQRRVLGLRVTDDDVILGADEKRIGDLTFCRKRLAAAGSA